MARHESVEHDIHVKRVPSGTFGGIKITHKIVKTNHPELKKRYGTKGDGLSATAVSTMKRNDYNVYEEVLRK